MHSGLGTRAPSNARRRMEGGSQHATMPEDTEQTPSGVWAQRSCPSLTRQPNPQAVLPPLVMHSAARASLCTNKEAAMAGPPSKWRSRYLTMTASVAWHARPAENDSNADRYMARSDPTPEGR